MRTMSLNCWVGREPEPLFAFIPTANADVLCLQEITWAPPGTPTFLHFRYRFKPERLLHYTNLYDKFCELLPDHYGFYWPAAEFDVFDDNGKAYPIRYGIATFVRKKYACLESRSSFVHASYWPGELRDPPVPSRAHALELWRPEQQRPIVIAHMHGLWDPAGKKTTPARDEQFEKFEALVKDMTTPGNPPTVVCGDFNILPDSQYLKSFKRMGFRELVEAYGYKSTRMSFYTRDPKKSPPYFADYMLVNSRVKVKNFDVIYDPEVSDHCPLVLDIE